MILNVIFSLIPVCILLFLIYMLEDLKKQPFWLLGLIFGLGNLSWVIVKFVSNILGYNIYETQVEVSKLLGNNGFFLITFGIIAIVEEGCKYIIMISAIIKNKKFRNPYDGILYASFISLGFAFAENIMYLNDNGLSIAISRAVFSVPIHACFGIVMGYYIGLSRSCKNKELFNDMYKLYYLGFFIPFIFHGMYDYLCSLSFPYHNIVFISYVVLLYGFCAYLIYKLYNVDVKLIELQKKSQPQVELNKKYRNIYYNQQIDNNIEKDNNSSVSNVNWNVNGENSIDIDENVTMNMFKHKD